MRTRPRPSDEVAMVRGKHAVRACTQKIGDDANAPTTERRSRDGAWEARSASLHARKIGDDVNAPTTERRSRDGAWEAHSASLHAKKIGDDANAPTTERRSRDGAWEAHSASLHAKPGRSDIHSGNFFIEKRKKKLKKVCISFKSVIQ